MPYALQGRNVLITGGSRYLLRFLNEHSQLIKVNRGLGALVAQKFAAEGSNIAINYVSNKEAADRVASNLAKEYNVKTIVVQGVCRKLRARFQIIDIFLL